MSRKARSVRGEEVDFDLLEIKSKMQSGDKPVEVKVREDFVHLKRRRRGRVNMSEIINTVKTNNGIPLDEEDKSSDTINSENVDLKASDDVDAGETIAPKRKRKIVKKDANE